MTVAILSILAALIPFGIWLYKRKAARVDDPLKQIEEKKNETDRIIKNHDARALNLHMDAVLRRLRYKSRSNTGEQGNGGGGGK